MAGSRLAFRLLGAFEASLDGRPIDLGGPTQRAVLALLVVKAGRSVSVDQLIDGIWEDDPPRTGRRTIQTYVFRLRRILPVGVPGGIGITTEAQGYRLDLADARVDSVVFERAVAAAASESDPSRRRTALVAALELWHGPALADLRDLRTFEAIAVRLEELRSAAIEDLVEARLELGETTALAADLEAMIADDPLRERLWRARMLALYRAGRQADALATYQRLRTRLRDELGLDPSADTQALEIAILRQDLTLERTAVAPRPVAVASRPRLGIVPRWIWPVVGLALVAAVGFAALAGTGSRPLDPAIVASIPVRAPVTDVAADASGLWVAFQGEDLVARVDLARHAVDATVRMPSPRMIAVTADAIWVTNEHADTLSRVDPIGIRLVDVLEIGDRPTVVAAGDDAMWVSIRLGGRVVRLDPNDGSVLGRYDLGQGPDAIAAVSGGAWVAAELASQLWQLHVDGTPASGPLDVGQRPRALAVADAAVWAVSWEDGTLARIDADTREVTDVVAVASAPSDIAVLAGRVWVADWRGEAVVVVDPATLRVEATVPLPGRPVTMAVRDGVLWVGFDDTPRLVGIRPEG